MSTERIQYGVIEDRTAKGHGHLLAYLTYNLSFAEMHLEALSGDHPAEIKQRVVITGDWQPVG